MPSQTVPLYVPRHSVADYRRAADKCFDKFSFLYRWSGNFWRLGHSFDTAIDYLTVKDDQGRAREFARDVLNAFADTRGHWYDDYGWWGLAASRALARKQLFGEDLTERFQGVRDRCWKFMDTGDAGDMKVICCNASDPRNGIEMAGAPNVFEQAHKYPNGDPGELYNKLAPRFPGGVWNCDWYYSQKSYADPSRKFLEECYCLPIFDSEYAMAKDSLGGYQNTVTNALYFSLASRMGAAAAAKRTHDFLDAWIRYTGRGDEGIVHVAKYEEIPLGYIRERVPSYKNPNVDVWGYRRYLAWAGDQGLTVAAFADYLQINPGNSDLRKLLLDRSTDLLRGALYYIAEKRMDGNGALVPGGRLRDWHDPDSPAAPGGDAGNYRTGSGAFWRSVQHAYEIDGDFERLIPAIGGFKDFLAFNADAACDSAAATLPEHVRSPDEALVGVTNDLATLMAGIRILGDS